MQICFFQDALSTGLHPLTLTRTPDDLRIGLLRIHEKWAKFLETEHITRILPDHMKNVFPDPDILEDQPCLWINGRYLPDPALIEQINSLKEDEGITFDSLPVIVKVSGRRSAGLFQSGNISTTDISFTETAHGSVLSQPWQIFTQNDAQIRADIELLKLKPADLSKFEGVHFINGDQIFIGNDVRIEPGCVISAQDGPVFIGDHAQIMAGALIRGSAAICEHAVIKMGAKIYDGTTIGPWCKIGGEVNNVVFHGYSNKAHDGFLGNSAIGEWCNFGADTNNSNMKNNYSNVRLTDWVSTREYDTELQFCGTIMGDHSKTAINTVLNTGTVCGVSSNIFSGKFPNKHIKSFRWIGPESEDIYKFDKAMETAGKMMQRRGKEVTPEYRSMMRHIFDKAER